MVIAPSFSPSSVSGPAATDPPASRARDGDGRFAEFGGVATVAFEVLLDATRNTVAGKRVGGDKASPAQVFEPNAADAHEQRQAALEEEYRSDGRDLPATERLEDTSVQARRMQRLRQSGDAAFRSAGGEQTASADPKAGARASPAGVDRGGSPGYAASPGPDRTAEQPSGTVVSSTDAHGDLRTAAQPTAVQATQAATARQQTRPAAGAAVDAVSAAGPSSGSKVQIPAQQVAQILGAGRTGEVESARAATQPPAATNARPSDAEQKTAGRDAAAKQETSHLTPRQSGGADAKAGPAERSAFDELVRSIRLRTGPWQSSARLHLEPPELGRLRVDMKIEGDVLHIDVRTETAAARKVVSARAAELTAALEQHGIHVDRFEVTSDPPDDDASGSFQGDGQGSGLTENRKTTEQYGALGSRGGGVSSEEAGAGAERETGVVSETRLDIRV